MARCWNPSPNTNLLAAAVGSKVVMIATGTGDKDSSEMTAALLKTSEEQYSLLSAKRGEENSDDDGDDEEGDEEAV